MIYLFYTINGSEEFSVYDSSFSVAEAKRALKDMLPGVRVTRVEVRK